MGRRAVAAAWVALVLGAVGACATAGASRDEPDPASAFDALLDHNDAIMTVIEENFGDPEIVAAAVNRYADAHAAEIAALARVLREYAKGAPEAAQKVAALRAERTAQLANRWQRLAEADPECFADPAVERALRRVTPEL